ncbi:MAG: phosphoribosylglycinamide formyltransferase [Gammaproteobacteria bacterium]|nr:phosphoribosylglycinamide formyltransferase [Gammaproteobacteria bacterium]
MPSTRCALVVLISGSGSNLQAIIDAQKNPDFPAEISAVISNKTGVKGLERASKAGIATEIVSHRDYPNREIYDAELARVIDRYNPCLVILAGFMRILTDDFVNRYAGRMLNIHPSLLPKYKGLNTHQQAIDAGDREHGATVHFVTPDLDSGPLIIQARVAVLEDDTADALAARVLEKEHIIYPRAISQVASGHVTLANEVVSLNGEPLSGPQQL